MKGVPDFAQASCSARHHEGVIAALDLAGSGDQDERTVVGEGDIADLHGAICHLDDVSMREFAMLLARRREFVALKGLRAVGSISHPLRIESFADPEAFRYFATGPRDGEWRRMTGTEASKPLTARNPDGIDPGRPGPTLAVLMATKNGGPFLDEQLRSLEAQTYARIDLWVSDDGSDDSTLQLLATWTNRWKKGRMTVLRGPRQGFAENFRSLLLNADIDAEFFAYCDQDDIWEERKTERAVSWLSTIPAALPALFCSRTLTISESGEPVGVSRLFRREPSFRNALVQSIAGGNTMTFNRAARDLVADASRTASFISHDWWTYLLVTGSGGAVHYSAEPLVRYRQHRDNQVGANGSFRAMLVRLKRLAHGDFVHWTTANIEGLSRNSNLLTEDAREALVQLANSRMRGWRERVESLRSSGVYRQSRAGNLALYLAAALGRL